MVSTSKGVKTPVSVTVVWAENFREM